MIIAFLFRNDNSYDIAMIEVFPPFQETDRIKFLQLPPSNIDATGTCRVAGWGSTETELSSNVLLKVQVPIVPKNECQLIYSQFDNQTQICAGKEGADVCLVSVLIKLFVKTNFE